MTKHKETGFTLIEISVVLVLIGLIMGGIYNLASSSMKNAKISDAVSLISDLSNLAREFKSRYRYLPGDMPTATTEIAGTTGNGNGDGVIDLGERMFVAEHLFRSGFTKGGIGNTTTSAPFTTKYGRAWIISAALARLTTSPCTGSPSLSTGIAIDNTAPSPNAQNVILLESLPGDVAEAIDSKLDDGIFNSGKVRASSAYTADATISCLGVAF